MRVVAIGLMSVGLFKVAEVGLYALCGLAVPPYAINAAVLCPAYAALAASWRLWP